MKRQGFSKIWPVAGIAVLLGSLAAGAPSYNADQVAPASVFLVLPDEIPTPKLHLEARQVNGRWSLRINASNFQFTALCLSTAKAIPLGHAHVMVDGHKVGSAYTPQLDLGELPPGKHVISVVLRGQDHRALIGRDGLIRSEVVIISTGNESDRAPSLT